MLTVINHPVINNKLSLIRDKNTSNREFRALIEEVATILCYEATKDLKVIDRTVETPVEITETEVVYDKIGVVTILRAGMGMLNGIYNFMPFAKVGHIGIFRDPNTLQPIQYYCKLPIDSQDRIILLLDPMLATGGTASTAIKLLKNAGVKRIKLLNIISAPEGVSKIEKEYSDVEIYSAALDKGLNSHGYITPGLGDAGDRIYGTK